MDFYHRGNAFYVDEEYEAAAEVTMNLCGNSPEMNTNRAVEWSTVTNHK